METARVRIDAGGAQAFDLVQAIAQKIFRHDRKD
jgi:hypothetical protein